MFIKNKNSQAGVTFLELIITITIASVLMVATIPSMQRSWDNRKLNRALKSMQNIGDAVRGYTLERNYQMAFNDLTGQLLPELENQGFLNSNELESGINYSWETPVTLVAGKPSGEARIKGCLIKGGTCSSDIKDAAIYQIDFTNGRGNDLKLLGGTDTSNSISHRDPTNNPNDF